MRKFLSGRWLYGLLPALGVLVTSAAVAPPAEAQVRAVMVTTTGERHEGVNLGYRIDEGDVAVRTGPHTEPRLPVGQVALIEFAPPARETPPDEIERRRAGDHLLVLRDGTLIRGRLVEVGHVDRGDQTTPYIVTFRTEAGEERRLDVGQVSRIYLADPRKALAPTVGVTPPAPAEGIRVSARQQWTPTGILVREGEMVTFQSSGEIQLSQDPGDVARPAGSLRQRLAANAPLPQALAGALLGRVGTSPPFGIGDQTQVRMPAGGQLFLGINDDHLEDNQGEFIVKIERPGQSRRR